MEELSDYLRKRFDDAIKNQPLKYELINKRWDEFNRVFKIPTCPIPQECSIYNLKSARDENPELITIGAIRSYTSAGKDKGKMPVFYSMNDRLFAQDNQGQMTFDRKNKGAFAYNKQLAMYLFFCAYNETNKGEPWHIPSPNSRYIFKQIDKKKEARISVSIEMQTAENLALLKQIPEDELLSLGQHRYNLTEPETDEVMQLLIKEVKKNPLVLSEVMDSKKQTLLSNLKKAESNNVIAYNATTKKWTLGGNLLFVNETEGDRLEALSNHLINGNGGLRKHEMIMDGLVATMKT